jgi:hypothetical protein
MRGVVQGTRVQHGDECQHGLFSRLRRDHAGVPPSREIFQALLQYAQQDGVGVPSRKALTMNSQEELAGCLQQLMEALAPKHGRRLSIVRDGDKPLAAGAKGHGRDQDVVTAPKPAAVV